MNPSHAAKKVTVTTEPMTAGTCIKLMKIGHIPNAVHLGNAEVLMMSAGLTTTYSTVMTEIQTPKSGTCSMAVKSATIPNGKWNTTVIM